MEILLILVVALVLFGPTRLPELGKSLGKGIREFRRGTQGLKDELELSLKDAPAQSHSQTAAQPQVNAQSQAAAQPQVAVQTQPLQAQSGATPAAPMAPMPQQQQQQVVYSAAPGTVTPAPAQAAQVAAPAPAAAAPLRASDLAVAPVVQTPVEGDTELPATDTTAHRA